MAWYDFDKVTCLSKIGASAEMLSDSIQFCSDADIKEELYNEIHNITLIMDKIINKGVF